MDRTFTDAPAVRERVPLLIGLVGPSGAGKTYSMLRLLTGMQSEVGGEIGVIDTEARRSLWYADTFQFRHLDFKAPFGPLDYLAAIEHFYQQGVRNIGIDSMSHEHEGPGGVLDQHDQEVQRLMSAWKTSADKVNFAAWVKPKAARQRLTNVVTQLSGVNLVACFRAKEKLKIIPGKEPVHLGWQAIGGDEFTYEMTLNLLLPPNSGGVPDLNPKEIGEKALLKIPAQFRGLVKAEPLSEALGASLARWAAGGAVTHTLKGDRPAAAATERKTATNGDTKALLDEIGDTLTKHFGNDHLSRNEALLSAFGTNDRKAIAKMDAEALAVGLRALHANLDGLAAMAREPRSDDE